MMDLARGTSTRLTFDPQSDVSSVLSPDGSEVIYASNRSGQFEFFRRASNGTGSEQLILPAKQNQFPDDWSEDGKYLLYEVDNGPQYKFDLFVLPLTGDPTPFPYLQTPFIEGHAQFSPDGRWVAYASDESGRPEVYVQNFPASGGKWQISTAGGDQPQWRSDGKELYYVAPDRTIVAVSVNATAGLDIGRPVTLFQTNMAIVGLGLDRNNYLPSSDGQKFLVIQVVESASLQPWNVLLNWNGSRRQ